jgi:hypothetical protein
MNPLDDQLDRLFRAAGKVRPGAVPEPAYGLETRVLAAWRSAKPAEAGIWDMALLVRGLIVASVIMVISFVPALNSSVTSESSANPYTDFVQLADSTASSDDAP